MLATVHCKVINWLTAAAAGAMAAVTWRSGAESVRATERVLLASSDSPC